MKYSVKDLVKCIPIIGSLAVLIKNKILPDKEFTNSKDYWIDRYNQGGNSGSGSYNNLAEFKGEIINQFVNENNIKTVFELGCGDGNQLTKFQFESYIGFDISDTVIQKCREKFKTDSSKKFMHMDAISNDKADMVMSLDVIYHLIEDEVYYDYLSDLFDLSNRYVIIYAFDSDEPQKYSPHVKPRKFTSWIKSNKSKEFKLIKHIPNRYPYDENDENTTSISDFYIYERIK